MFRTTMCMLAILVLLTAAIAQVAAPAENADGDPQVRSPSAEGIYRDVIAEVEQYVNSKFPDRVVSGEADVIMAIRQGIETSARFREIVERRDESVFREMIVQKHPFIEIAGLLGLKHVRPEAVAEATVIVLLKGNHIGVAGNAVSDVASGVTGTREFMDAVADQLRSRRFEDVGEMAIAEAVIGGRLTPAIIETWYSDSTRFRLPVSFEAYFYDFALDARRERNEDLSARMKADLETFAITPGFPQVVFAKHIEEEDPRLEQAMRAALIYSASLERPDGATLISLLALRRAYIREHINLDELDIPALRRELLERP